MSVKPLSLLPTFFSFLYLHFSDAEGRQTAQKKKRGGEADGAEESDMRSFLEKYRVSLTYSTSHGVDLMYS